MDVAGRRIATVIDAVLPPGQHEVTWNLTDHHGHRVPSGVYFCRLSSCGRRLEQKLVVLR